MKLQLINKIITCCSWLHWITVRKHLVFFVFRRHIHGQGQTYHGMDTPTVLLGCCHVVQPAPFTSPRPCSSVGGVPDGQVRMSIPPQTHRRPPHFVLCQMSPVLPVETVGKRELPFLLQTASPVPSIAGACARMEQLMEVFRPRMEADVSQHALLLLEVG